MPNVAYAQQCHICGKVIFGAGPLKRHVITCKAKHCSNCKDIKNCPATEWWQECPKNAGILDSTNWKK